VVKNALSSKQARVQLEDQLRSFRARSFLLSNSLAELGRHWQNYLKPLLGRWAGGSTTNADLLEQPQTRSRTSQEPVPAVKIVYSALFTAVVAQLIGFFLHPTLIN
jgi:hypothetical protein